MGWLLGIWMLMAAPLPPVPAAATARTAMAVCRSWSAPARLVCLERSVDWLAAHAPAQPSEADAAEVAALLLDVWDRDGVVSRAALYWLASHAPERLDGRLEPAALLRTTFFWRQASGDLAELWAPGLSDFGALLWRAWPGPGLPTTAPGDASTR